jgi:hypothetical protein
MNATVSWKDGDPHHDRPAGQICPAAGGKDVTVSVYGCPGANCKLIRVDFTFSGRWVGYFPMPVTDHEAATKYADVADPHGAALSADRLRLCPN